MLPGKRNPASTHITRGHCQALLLQVSLTAGQEISIQTTSKSCTMCDHGPVLPPGLCTQQSFHKKGEKDTPGTTCASPSNGITEFGDPPAEGTLWGPDEDPQVPLCQVSQ